MSNCDTQSKTCDTTQEKECCPVQTAASQDCCPVDKAVDLWSSSFFQAMKEAQVDILKEKIKTAWGPKMEKEADAIVGAMGVYWQSVLAQAKAKVDLKDSFRQIFESAAK